jgi:glycosyltransferase involved in cell wall biosynthesis
VNLIYFSSLLLPPSQTFIKAQGEMLQRFTAYYVGSRRVAGLNLPSTRTLVVNRGGLRGKAEEFRFKLSGVAPRCYRQVAQVKPVLMHAQFGLSGALALPWARALRIPLVVHYRGADAMPKAARTRYASLNHWIYFRRLHRLKCDTQLFIAVSQFIKHKLIQQGFPAHQIVHHYHGVDVHQFCPKPHIPREPVVLFVGRLTEKKGCQYLIEAMAHVQSTLPSTSSDSKLICIGDGPQRAQLESLAASKLRHYQFLGQQPAEVVAQWMNRSQVLAAPSVTTAQGDTEGLPNVVLEAQAMGLPVLSTRHAGIPEAVIHGQTGLLAPERDVAQLAAYARQLLTDTPLWQRLSRNGRAHVQAHFNRAEQTRVLESLYETVLAQARKP